MTSNIIEYVHNNKIVEIHNVDPNETLLNYIREKLRKTGTKEGCAEGACGACTIVLGNLKNNTISYQSVNACIAFLPTIHGKQLILVEDLISKSGKLHPVQNSMVNFHGSQCGFCTPGFIMSLFAMYKNYVSYDENIISDSISGNLCRCTGYKPIVNAAKDLNNKNRNDKFTKTKNHTINLLKKIHNKKNSLFLYNNKKKYFAPKNIKELKNIIKNNPESLILNGGTDLSLEVTKKRKTIESIIYTGTINELDYIKKENKFIEIGASTTLINFENLMKKYYEDFYQILRRYGSTQIRNVATIAGNIATASPIGDTLPILLTLDSEIVVGGLKKDRIIPINNFFIDYRKTKLKKGDFIKSIRIPLPDKSIFKAYKISKRIDDDISSVCASFRIYIENNIIEKIYIAYGGMANIPKRAQNCEKILLNKKISEKTIDLGQKILEKDFSPIDDMRASSIYRMEVAKNLLKKCFLEISTNKKIRINA